MVIFIYKKNFLKENYIVIILNGLHGVKRIVIINEIFFITVRLLKLFQWTKRLIKKI
jgi:hypothetical protein